MNAPDLLAAAVFVAGYLLGSVPFGLLLTRLFGAGDIRTIGSGNIGATNVLRTGRKGLAAATLLLDAGKGALAVVLAWWWFGGEPEFSILAGLGAMIGHCFPVWLGFKGGKGVATMLGICFALDLRIGAAAAATWLAMTLMTRISSVGGMSAAVSAPVTSLVLAGIRSAGPNALVWRHEFMVDAVALAIMAAIVLWRHRANIARLRAGTEPRIGSKG
jgi:acyl phosphate:glycerol-3-phosphate acyltransferase